MWNDLTMQQKSEVMKMAIAQGLTDLDEIKNMYNTSASNVEVTNNTYDYVPYSPTPKDVRYEDGGTLYTPDKDYQRFLRSLPPNQRSSKDFDVHRYWELNGRPRDFIQAITSDPPMYTLENDGYHASSVAYNKDNDTYEFMKSPEHPTVDLELLNYWNNPKMNSFREKYGLDMDSNPYKYIRRDSTSKPLLAYGGPLGNIYKGGGKSKQAYKPRTFRSAEDMIKAHEGFSAVPYKDGKNKKTGEQWYSIGYGFNDSGIHPGIGKSYLGKQMSRKEANRLLKDYVDALDKQLRNALGDKVYKSLTPGQRMAYLDTGYQRPASMINAARIHKTTGNLDKVARALSVQGFNDRNADRYHMFNHTDNGYYNYIDIPDRTPKETAAIINTPTVEAASLNPESAQRMLAAKWEAPAPMLAEVSTTPTVPLIPLTDNTTTPAAPTKIPEVMVPVVNEPSYDLSYDSPLSIRQQIASAPQYHSVIPEVILPKYDNTIQPLFADLQFDTPYTDAILGRNPNYTALGGKINRFDEGGPKLTQEDLDRNNWRWARRNELLEDDPLINTLGDNDKWIVDSNGMLVPTSTVNNWLNSYERQTPYQEQPDVAVAREMEKIAADRYVDSIGFSPVGKEIKDTAEMLVRYPVQYFASSFMPSSTYIDLSNERVATIDPDTKNVSSILFNDFLEDSNDSARPARDFYNTQDTLIGDRDIPVSNIKTFYGVEDEKLKVGPLDIFDKNTTVVPNRAKGGDQLLSKVIFNPDFHKYASSNKKNSEKVRQEVERRAKELGVRPSIMPMILNPFKHGIQQIPSMYDIEHTLGEDKYWELVDEAQKMYPIRFSKTDDYPYLGITVNNDTIPIRAGHPKTFFGNPEGKSIFVSNLTNNLNKVNAFLADNPSYIGLPDNGRFSGYQITLPSFASYRGVGTLPMYAVGTLSK